MDADAVYLCVSIKPDPHLYGLTTIYLERCDGKSGWAYVCPSEPEPFVVGRKYRLPPIEVKDG